MSAMKLSGSVLSRRAPVVLAAFAMVMSLSVVVGCGSAATNSDAGVDAGAADSGVRDAGVFSACGQPGDPGNSEGVGQYCQKIADCPNSAPICSAFQNSVQPASMQSYFCVKTCDECSPTGVCGSGASCVCQAPGACGCVPNACAALFPDGGSASVCKTADAGVDGGL